MQKLPPLDTTTPVSAEQMLSQPVPMSPKVQQNGGDQNRPEPLPGTNLSRSNSVEKNKENTIVKTLSEEEEGENSAAEVKEIDEGSGVRYVTFSFFRSRSKNSASLYCRIGN